MRTHHFFILPAAAVLVLGACTACSVGPTERGPEISPQASVGPNPTLPAPEKKKTIPVVQIAEAKGWPPGMKPTAPAGVQVNAFASGLQHPRWVYTLPNGDVLVAETAAPERPEDGKGIRGAFMKKYMEKAGSVVPSANRITLLRDADGDGVAEVKTQFLSGLNSPFGMALVGNDLYVANTDAIVKFPYQEGATSITAQGSIQSVACLASSSAWSRRRFSSAMAAATICLAFTSWSRMSTMIWLSIFSGFSAEEIRSLMLDLIRVDRRSKSPIPNEPRDTWSARGGASRAPASCLHSWIGIPRSRGARVRALR